MAGGWTYRGLLYIVNNSDGTCPAGAAGSAATAPARSSPTPTRRGRDHHERRLRRLGRVAVDGHGVPQARLQRHPGLLRRAASSTRSSRTAPSASCRTPGASSIPRRLLKPRAAACRSRDHVQVTPPPGQDHRRSRAGSEPHRRRRGPRQRPDHGHEGRGRRSAPRHPARRRGRRHRGAQRRAARRCSPSNELGTTRAPRRRQPAHRRAHARPPARRRRRRRSSAAVRAGAPDHIPVPMDEAVLDFQPLGTVETPAGPAHARRDRRRPPRHDRPPRRRHAATPASRSRASTSPRSRMVRALRAGRHASRPCSTSTSPASRTSPSPTTRGCLFTRAAAGGLDAIAQTLVRAPRPHASSTRAAGCSTSASATPLAAVEGDAELVAAVRQTLEEGVHQVADTRAQLAQLLPHAGQRGDRRARRAHRPRRRDPRLRRASSPRSCTCRSSPPSWRPTSRAPTPAA